MEPVGGEFTTFAIFAACMTFIAFTTLGGVIPF
jgi:hypothetical protein